MGTNGRIAGMIAPPLMVELLSYVFLHHFLCHVYLSFRSLILLSFIGVICNSCKSYHQHVCIFIIFFLLQESSEYIKRCAEVKAFNDQNKWVKRGISLIPVKFGASWEGQQMLSLVNVHTDASISIYQSGCEMGQGLDIKIAQVRKFSIKL